MTLWATLLPASAPIALTESLPISTICDSGQILLSSQRYRRFVLPRKINFHIGAGSNLLGGDVQERTQLQAAEFAGEFLQEVFLVRVVVPLMRPRTYLGFIFLRQV